MHVNVNIASNGGCENIRVKVKNKKKRKNTLAPIRGTIAAVTNVTHFYLFIIFCFVLFFDRLCYAVARKSVRSKPDEKGDFVGRVWAERRGKMEIQRWDNVDVVKCANATRAECGLEELSR